MGDFNDPFMRNQNAAVQARTKAQNRSNVLQLKLGHKNTTVIGTKIEVQNLVVLGDGARTDLKEDEKSGIYRIYAKLRPSV